MFNNIRIIYKILNIVYYLNIIICAGRVRFVEKLIDRATQSKFYCTEIQNISYQV